MGARSTMKRRIPIWTATLVLGSSLTAARAADDGFFSEAPHPETAPRTMVPSKAPSPESLVAKGLGNSDRTGAIAPRPTIDRADWLPDTVAPATRDIKPQGIDSRDAKRTDGKAPAKTVDKAADPEPDIAIVPPAAPSKDPLDHVPTAKPVAMPVPEALPPLNAALKAALDKRDGEAIRGPNASERRKERSAVAFFYSAHGFTPVWSGDGKPTASVDGVLARLAKAGDDALTLPAVPTAIKATGTPEEIVASELALTDAVVAYARQASGSRIDPKGISPLIGSMPSLADPAEVLDAVSTAGAQSGDKLAASNPRDPRYLALRDKLAELRAKQRPAKAPLHEAKSIPAGPTLRIGMRDKRVPLLRARLGAAAGFVDDVQDTLFDPLMSDALADWQRANDVPATGALDKRTLAAMNGNAPASSSRLEGTLIANMEMWRWMPRDLGTDRIEVNIPDYLVRVYRDGAVMDEHRVVVGKTDTPTPLFSNAMKYLIVNPYWNVPQSIIKKEMLPKGGGSLAYLDGHGYEVGWHGDMPTVKQLPGPKNALGQIKFLFPNDYSVYLHDTPSKALFAASKRAFSHGCVRVDKPFAFAESVLNAGQPDSGKARWNEERLKDMVGDKERYVNLAKPLPIHIEYFTASIEPGGTVRLREDVYGYVHAVATALGQDSEPAGPVFKPPKEPKPAAVADRAHRRAVDVAEEQMPMAPPSRSFWGSIFDPR